MLLKDLFSVSGTAIQLSIKLAQVLKLIDSLESEVGILINAEYKTAFENLTQANISKNSIQQVKLINEARHGFTKSTFMVKGESLFCSYYGLALCQELLGDRDNCVTTFKKFVVNSVVDKVLFTELNSNLYFNKYSFYRTGYIFKETLEITPSSSLRSIIRGSLLGGILSTGLAVVTGTAIAVASSALTVTVLTVAAVASLAGITETTVEKLNPNGLNDMLLELEKHNSLGNNTIADITKRINLEEKIISTARLLIPDNSDYSKLISQSLALISTQKEVLESLKII
ncbi:hypothetical protein [Nostoc sp.]|uniref:hypothetical protein n=1 Tax=Nostoc sp. TaxID=1180 RepID=UPI002FFAE2FF